MLLPNELIEQPPRIVSAPLGRTTRFQLLASDADGQLISARFGNGLTQTRGYDLQGRLVEQNLFDDGGAIIDARRYAYDPAGNITVRSGTPGDQRYDYDVLDRLISQGIPTDDKAWQYDYDRNHNRLRRGDSGGLNEVYGYQPKTNRLIEIDKLIDTPEAEQPRSKHFTSLLSG